MRREDEVARRIAVHHRRALLTLAALLALLVTARPAGLGIRSAGEASARGLETHRFSVARLWDEQLLAAIRIDIPKPPAHARNLFHLSVAMWDAWAAYDPLAVGYLVTDKYHLAPERVEAARAEAISYAAYRLLKYRFPVGYVDINGQSCHPNAGVSQAAFDTQMDALGYDRTFTGVDGDSPAALGNRIAATVIRYGQGDGANEGPGLCYPDATGYAPDNPPLIFKLPGVDESIDCNRWQPLSFDYQVTQNGIAIGQSTQTFVGVGWNNVRPFALGPDDLNRATKLYLDPGPQPHLGGRGDWVVKDAVVELIRFSGYTDVAQTPRIDISPAAFGNNSLGADDGTGYPENPASGQPYTPTVVNGADFVRVVAEFWSDGPHSETPPGHWNVLANGVADHPLMHNNKRIAGQGPVVDDLEWDVKVYLAVNGAVHDAAIWAWGNKTVYDSSRPITLIRYMAGRGQSSDPSGASYDPEGLPLVPGVIELITRETTRPGGRHAALAGHEGEIAVRIWAGGPADPATQTSGVGWKRGVEWLPYQPTNFVTPPFPGYTSGHSTFSRAAAEVLAAITGSPFFPGGLGTFVAAQDAFLRSEKGPNETVRLQWATFYDAADQAGLSRRFGGIHPFYDDYPSRIAGARIGQKAWVKAQEFYGVSLQQAR